ncbi:hypothetical protein APT89_05525 [Enterobacter sp. 50588862]|nr:hypothetical protein APT89_05525 [Enterobacter sp. 50588862]
MLISAGTHTERFSQKPILALGKDTVAVTKILLTATARTHRLHAQTYQLQTIVDLYHLAGGIPIAQGGITPLPLLDLFPRGKATGHLLNL